MLQADYTQSIILLLKNYNRYKKIIAEGRGTEDMQHDIKTADYIMTHLSPEQSITLQVLYMQQHDTRLAAILCLCDRLMIAEMTARRKEKEALKTANNIVRECGLCE